MPDPLSVALGAVVTAAVGGVLRAPGIPASIRRNDARVAARDRTLETWTADRDHLLRRECKAIRAAVPPGGDPDTAVDLPGARVMELLAQGSHEAAAREADKAIALAKERALWEWRDEAARADDDIAEIMAGEGWAHVLWRRLRHRPALTLGARDRVAPILNAWRMPTAMHPERWTYPDDPIRRTLDAAIASMPVTGP